MPAGVKNEKSRAARNSTASIKSLIRERQRKWTPVLKSPFALESKDVDDHDSDELKVNRSEVLWSDLLLEVAMATTFASLTDGTPILRPSNVVSYLSFFALVWWTWASQVAYNVRFRQPDWLHRLFVFLQLLVFAALSAFTNSFDITDGLRVNRDQETIERLQLADFRTMSDVEAARFRNGRMPVLNARGVSMVMALSRLLLFVQYALALYHARKHPSLRPLASTSSLSLSRPSSRNRAHALHIHLFALFLSTISYAGAFVMLGTPGTSSGPTKALNALKLVLWFGPILLELLAHFVANTLPGRVRYEPEAVYARAATLFIIILGGGLDKITNSFQYIVGNVAFGSKGAGLIFSAVVIFTAQFALYFGMSENPRPSDNRALAWFFSHFFYLSALIVTLQAVAALLVFGNIGVALHLPIDIISTLGAPLHASPTTLLNASNPAFHALQRPLFKIGVSLDSVVAYVNQGVAEGVRRAGNGTSNETEVLQVVYGYLLQQSVESVAVILQNFDAMPDRGTLLSTQISAFLDNDPTNATIVNNASYIDIVENVFYSRGQPALWFYAAAGATLVSLAAMNFIIRWPRDKFEWGTSITRLTVGFLVISMSALDVGASNALIDSNLRYTGSRIWSLALHSWVLPPFAMVISAEQLIELILVFLAGREFRRINGATFGFNTHRRNSGQRLMGSNDSSSGRGSGAGEFVPIATSYSPPPSQMITAQVGTLAPLNTPAPNQGQRTAWPGPKLESVREAELEERFGSEKDGDTFATVVRRDHAAYSPQTMVASAGGYGDNVHAIAGRASVEYGSGPARVRYSGPQHNYMHPLPLGSGPSNGHGYSHAHTPVMNVRHDNGFGGNSGQAQQQYQKGRNSYHGVGHAV